MAETSTDTSQPRTVLDELDDDDLYRLLADEHRRAAVTVRHAYDDSVSLDELATVVASETDATETASVKVELHHVHLPLMRDLGVLEYDAETRHVDFREPATEPPAS